MITFNKIYNVSRDRLRVETATYSFLWNNNRLREWFSVPYNPVESSINFATERSRAVHKRFVFMLSILSIDVSLLLTTLV